MGRNGTRISALLSAGLATAALSACTADNPAFDPPEAVCQAGEYFVGQPFTLADSSAVDILLVVDNSPGMAPNQLAFAEAMPALVNRLNAVDGLDWRAGVISTDLADQGVPQTGATGGDCPANLPSFVERSTPGAALALGCNVLLGQEGSEFEQGLEAARRAIEGGAGFLREDARLVIVFFSDEDDCTAQLELDRSDPNNCVWQQDALVNVEDFGRYFASSARRRSGNPVSVVSVVGPNDNRSYVAGETPEAACNGLSSALSGNRYIAIAETPGIDRYGFFESICSTSYVATVERIVDHAVSVEDDELCVSLPMSGTPRSVVVKDASGDVSAELSEFGEYLVIGQTDRCPNGAIAIAADAHDDASGHTVEVRFCTTEDPSAQ